MALGTRRKPATVEVVDDQDIDEVVADSVDVTSTGDSATPSEPASTDAGADAATEVDAAVGDAAVGYADASAEEVAALKASLVELQTMVATLVDRSAGASAEERESDTASRIILAANRAAESAVETARAEAETLIAEAKTQSLEIISAARELADRELTAERQRLATAADEWVARRTELLERLATVDASLAGYRTGLADATSTVHDAIGELAAEIPGAIGSPPAELDTEVEADVDAEVVAEPSAEDASPAEVDATAEPEDVPATTSPAKGAAIFGAAAVRPDANTDGTGAPEPQRSNLFGGPAGARIPRPPVGDAVAPSAPSVEAPVHRAGFFGR
ncbi:MAG: hypothetical protein U0Q22_19575 [Acidimicrobiales bacterium]